MAVALGQFQAEILFRFFCQTCFGLPCFIFSDINKTNSTSSNSSALGWKQQAPSFISRVLLNWSGTAPAV